MVARQERRKRKLTQAQTAEMLGYTQKWVSDFETGKADPPMSMVLNLMTGLGQQLTFGTAVREPVVAPAERELDMDDI